ncbi:MAG: hypothetical protein GX915_07800 [Clostridiales bacterium]|nr:hypothetical protein [Clostridiales bacterium]
MRWAFDEEIQKVGFGTMINVEFSLDEDLLSYQTIKLILQPVVENSIHHGIIDEEHVLNINISLYEENDRIIFEVADDGKGMEDETVLTLNEELQTVAAGMD